MDRSALRCMLAEVLEEVTGESPGPIHEDQNIQTQLNLDSVDMVSMAIEVQTRLGIVLETSELMAVDTVASLLDLFERKLDAAEPIPPRRQPRVA